MIRFLILAELLLASTIPRVSTKSSGDPQTAMVKALNKISKSLDELVNRPNGLYFFPSRGTNKTTERAAYARYPRFHADFVGFGFSKSCGKVLPVPGVNTVESCIEECFTERSKESRIDGMYFRIESDECACAIEAVGYRYDKGALFYSFKSS